MSQTVQVVEEKPAYSQNAQESYKLQLAKSLGIYQDGFGFIDYCLEGAPKSKWICAIISGEKGTYKSNTLLQHGYAVFHGYDKHDEYNKGYITDWDDMKAWQTTLKYVCYRPLNFAKLLDEAIKEHRRRSWIGWDDIAIHLSTILYSTDRKKWEVLHSNWVGFRGLLSVFECTAPAKSDVINFIRKDMNFEIQMTARKVEEVYRWFKRGNLYDPMKDDHYRIDIETPTVDPYRVPKEIWEQYDSTTLAIREESAKGMRDTLLEMDAPIDTKAGAKREQQLKECPWCHRVMNYWNWNLHEKNCKQKPQTLTNPN